VDPSVVEFSSSYDTEKFLVKFLAKYPVLKAGEDSDDSRDPDYFRILPCGLTERVCMDRANAGPPFFYMYTCFFSDLHVSLPFDEFTMGILQALNVAPTQVHPNTWASLQAFRLLCDAMRLRRTPSSFVTMVLTPVVLPLGFPWPAGRDVYCSTLLRSRISGLRKGLSRSSFGPRRRPFSLIEMVGLGSPYIGPPSPNGLSFGRGRRKVRRRWRFSPSSTHSQGSFLADR